MDRMPKMHLMCKKSNQHSGKMTEAIYLEVSEKTEAAKRLDAGFPSPEC